MVEPAVWEDVKEIALSALELRDDERSQFLEHACKSDQGLRAAVEAVLSISTRDAAAVDRFRLGLVEKPPVLPPGTIIDNFQIVDLLGTGGMGVVYLADDARNERRVALKVLSTHARFNRGEHKVLAKLDHPFIATLYDSGNTPGGFPYLAMEYVPGLPLADYCATQKPTLKQRLVLFQEICEGVQAAHQKFVVHRDLTPNNIRVTPDGKPKLLDFGIAREIDGDVAASDVEEHRAMTPLFASPEQRRGEGVEATSDIYSLGILLCGLVTGRHPHTLDDLRQPLGPTNEPPPPSSLIQSDDHPLILPPPPVAPARLKKLVRGDLDVVILKALQADPAERYQTAEKLGEDIGRHVAILPIRARPATWRYRLGKLVRRRPWRLLVVAALVIMAGLLFSQYRRAVRGERAALAQVERTRHVNRFVVDLLRPTNPFERSSSPDISVDELLDQSAKTVEAGLNEYPDLKASLLSVLGEIFGARGDAKRGRVLLQRALALQWRGPRDVALAESLLRYGGLLTGQGQYRQSDAAFAEAAAILATTEERDDPVLQARLLMAQAANKVYQADYEAARLLSQRALVYLRDSPRSFVELATSLLGLGRVLEINERNEEAQALFEQALSYAERLPDVRNPHAAIIINSLGVLRYKEGDYAGAEQMLLRALEIERVTLGEDSRVYAVTLHNLAAVDAALGEYKEAFDKFTTVVGILQGRVPPHHVTLLTARDQLASTLVRLQDYDRAEAMFQETLTIEKESLPTNHPARAVTLNNLGYLYQDTGRLQEAEASYAEALGIFEALLGRRSRPAATLLGNLGSIAHSRGDIRGAERRYREALGIAQDVSDGRTPEGITAMVNLAGFDISTGNLADARSLLAEAMPLAESVVGPDDWLTGFVHFVEAKLLLAEGEASGALSKARRARAIMEAKLPRVDSRLASTDSVIGAALGRMGKTAEAEPLLLHSLRELRRLKGERSVATREAMERVRSFYESLGRHDEAAKYQVQ
jgi:serine/threonine-protein kinase